MKKVTLLLAALLVFTAISLSAQNAQTRLDNGKRLFDQQNYNGAIRELDEAIRLDPNLAEAYAYRSWAHGQNNNNTQALKDANRAIQLNSRLALGYFTRGRAYQVKNDNDRAIADYTEAIRHDPQNRSAYNNRSMLYTDKKDLKRAIADLTEVIRIDPKYVNAYLRRSAAYVDIKENYEQALVDVEMVIKLDPQYSNNSTVKDLLAKAKQGAEAEKRQKAAVVTNNYDPSKFAVVPSDFRHADYTKVDLFKAVSTSKNLEISSNKYDAMSNQLKTDLSFGV
jgi:tetratricopeptide (TPR) repeat protein